MPRPYKRTSASAPSGSSDLHQVIFQYADAQRSGGLRASLNTLPNELLDELMLYFPTIPVHEVMMAHGRGSPGPVLHAKYRERFDALRVLSQTCKRLRTLYFVEAWTRFEACTIRDDSERTGPFFRQLGIRLEKKCNGLMKCAHVLPLVQVMTVSLTRFQAKRIVPIFMDLLSVLPNLHSLEFVHVHSQMSNAIGSAAQDKKFPSIRTIILPNVAHDMLKSTPAVENVTCNEDNGGLITTSIRRGNCTNIKRLAGVKLTEVYLKRMVDTLTSLHTIVLEPYPDSIKLLSHFHIPSLAVIELTMHASMVEPFDDIIAGCTTVAKDVLARNTNVSEKKVQFRHYNWTASTDPISESNPKLEHEIRVDIVDVQ